MDRIQGDMTLNDPRRYLRGIHFPAKKDDLVHAARQNGAPNDVVSGLENLTTTEIRSEQHLVDLYPRRP